MANDGLQVGVAGSTGMVGAEFLRLLELRQVLYHLLQIRLHAVMVFEERVRAFVAPTERGKRVLLRVGDRTYGLKRSTRRNGRFMGTIRLRADQINSLGANLIMVTAPRTQGGFGPGTGSSLSLEYDDIAAIQALREH